MSTAVDTAPVALTTGDPDVPMTVHITCRLCFPRGTPFPLAICGEKLLGIHPNVDKATCPACAELMDTLNWSCGH